jgi:hypothetical protein
VLCSAFALGLLWYGLGIEPAAVPLITLRRDNYNRGLGNRTNPTCVQVVQGGKIYIITPRAEHQFRDQLQMLVVAPDGKVISAVPLRRKDGRPLTVGVLSFVVNPPGTLWWTVRHATEDWKGKGTAEPVILSAHGADGYAQQEWELAINILDSELAWLYAAGGRQVYAYYWDTRGKKQARAFTMGLPQSRRLDLSPLDTVMPDGSVWQYDTHPDYDPMAPTQRFTYTFSHTPPGGTPTVWASFPEPFTLEPVTIIPSETGLFVLASPSNNTYPVYRIPRDGQLECIFDLSHLLKWSGRMGERIEYWPPVYVNRHGDVWVATTTFGEKERSIRSTLWKLTHRPRWQNWLQALSNLTTPR